MFPNLNAEIGRAKLTIKRLSEITNINYETLKLKLRGVTEFKLAEMISIKKNAFPDKTLDYLFQTDEEKKTGQGGVVNTMNLFNVIIGVLIGKIIYYSYKAHEGHD